MANPSTVQIEAFVHAIDYTRCRARCCEPGYTVASEGAGWPVSTAMAAPVSYTHLTLPTICSV